MKKEQSDEYRLVPSTVRMTAGATAALDEIAAEHHISRSELIRLAVDDRLMEWLGQVQYVDSDQAEEIRLLLGRIYTEMDRIRIEINRIGVNYNQQIRKLHGGQSHDAQLPYDAIKTLMQQYDECTDKAGEVLCILG